MTGRECLATAYAMQALKSLLESERFTLDTSLKAYASWEMSLSAVVILLAGNCASRIVTRRFGLSFELSILVPTAWSFLKIVQREL